MIDIILHSNLFNFAIFLLIIILIAKKVDFDALFEKMRNDVISKIDASDEAKKSALSDLAEAKKSCAQTENEIKEINDSAKTTSETMKANIIEDANTKVHSIAKNSKNIVANEEKQIASALIKNLGKKSVEQAQEFILNELSRNKDLHYRFIDESINDLDEAVL